MFLNNPDCTKYRSDGSWTGDFVILYESQVLLAVVLTNTTLYARTPADPYEGVYRLLSPNGYRFDLPLKGQLGNLGRPFPVEVPSWYRGHYLKTGAMNHYCLPSRGCYVDDKRLLGTTGEHIDKLPEAKAKIIKAVERRKPYLRGSSLNEFLNGLENDMKFEARGVQGLFTDLVFALSNTLDHG